MTIVGLGTGIIALARTRVPVLAAPASRNLDPNRMLVAVSPRPPPPPRAGEGSPTTAPREGPTEAPLPGARFYAIWLHYS